MNPLKLITNRSSFLYQQVPDESRNGSPFNLQPLKKYRWPSPGRRAERLIPSWGRFSPSRMLWIILASLITLTLLAGGGYHRRRIIENKEDTKPEPFFWQTYPRLNGFYNGIRTLVPYSDYTPENQYNKSAPLQLITSKEASKLSKMPPMNPITFNPYPDYDSQKYLQSHEKVHKCFLDDDEKVLAPDVYAYPGIPQNMSLPFYGSYELMGLENKMCFDRYSRFAPYGYGYTPEQGGLGPGNKSENNGADKVFYRTGIINYTNIDWGTLQDRCYQKNKARFEDKQLSGREKVQRHAYVLRIWQDFYFNEHQMFSLRAMINELSLKSGGEYDVHFLLHVKDNSIPIWASDDVYAQVIQENMPEEFWNMTTLWSEAQMVNYYPPPFGETFENIAGSGVHGVYRSAHFPLQWFAQKYPDYDFYWNWEMDLRYIGHYYEFNTRIGEWAKEQPRKGLWERSERFYIPELHGSWHNFTEMVEKENRDARVEPIWGPVSFPNNGMLPSPGYNKPPTSYDKDDYEWGVGEDADFISFNPIFDPTKTNWVFRNDITSYDMKLEQPPRRTSIITVARLSKRILDVMHEETWRLRHTMFPEMWPPTVALHHGFKAVYAPHPVYFDRDWDLQKMDQVFNHPKEIWESPFGWGEHNLLGSSFYYNSGFSGALWRRWLGQAENNEGGRKYEDGGSGRLCLRSMLHHPIKHELNSMD